MLAREPATFWRENVIAVVILQRVLARMLQWREQVITVRSFIILLSGEVLTSFSMNDRTNCLVKKKKLKMNLSRVSSFLNKREHSHLNFVLVLVLVLKSKAL